VVRSSFDALDLTGVMGNVRSAVSEPAVLTVVMGNVRSALTELPVSSPLLASCRAADWLRLAEAPALG
jgi:hypothetical protein